MAPCDSFGRMLVALTMLAGLAAAQDTDPRQYTPFLTFSRSASSELGAQSVDIGVLRGEGRLQFWFRRTVERDGPDDIAWTSTESCAGARDAVVAATQFAPPRVSVPGLPMRPDGSSGLTLDGVQYAFRSSAHYDSNGSSSISFTSNVGTPLANWVEGSLAILEECWADEVPQHGGGNQPSSE